MQENQNIKSVEIESLYQISSEAGTLYQVNYYLFGEPTLLTSYLSANSVLEMIPYPVDDLFDYGDGGCPRLKPDIQDKIELYLFRYFNLAAVIERMERNYTKKKLQMELAMKQQLDDLLRMGGIDYAG